MSYTPTPRTTAYWIDRFTKGHVLTPEEMLDLVASFAPYDYSTQPDPPAYVLPDPLPARNGQNLTNITPDQWRSFGVNASYASFTQFLLTGDFTATLPPGIRLRFNRANGDYYYDEVISVTYDALTDISTVTIVGDLDGTETALVEYAFLVPADAGGIITPRSLGHLPFTVPFTSGDGATYTVSLGISKLRAGHVYDVMFNVVNTGACTLNIDGLGAVPIKTPAADDYAAGGLRSYARYSLYYNGTILFPVNAPQRPVQEGGTGRTSINKGQLLIGNNQDPATVLGHGGNEYYVLRGGANADDPPVYDALANFPEFALSGGVNGSQLLPGGIIRNWGTFSNPDTNALDTTVTLTTPFPTRCNFAGLFYNGAGPDTGQAFWIASPVNPGSPPITQLHLYGSARLADWFWIAEGI